jgi:hypothetical protein
MYEMAWHVVVTYGEKKQKRDTYVTCNTIQGLKNALQKDDLFYFPEHKKCGGIPEDATNLTIRLIEDKREVADAGS